ncbi:hypothetical protein BGZ60DRAFT_409480 [Tricladium varicosporioides]|nr:hypothetical protein BGZ60DRAFT_409480 [Hymenoscyphus varicosporioides]
MPTSFLSLPRELRDEIYKLVLLSPDGFVQMQLVIYGKKMDSQQSRRIKSPQKPATFKRSAHKNLDKQSHFRLLHNPTQSHLADLATQAEMEHSEYSTLSLLRVNQQLYRETRNLFWHNTGFCFSAYQPPSTEFLTAVRFFKRMGQTASRLITHVRLCMSLPSLEKTCLPKVLQNLASRSRHGCFKKLELEWDAVIFEGCALFGSGVVLDESYYKMLDDLRHGCEAARFERIVMVRNIFECDHDEAWNKRWQKGSVQRERLMNAAKDIHHAVGGQFFVGERLLWDNFEEVGD